MRGSPGAAAARDGHGGRARVAITAERNVDDRDKSAAGRVGSSGGLVVEVGAGHQGELELSSARKVGAIGGNPALVGEQRVLGLGDIQE